VGCVFLPPREYAVRNRPTPDPTPQDKACGSRTASLGNIRPACLTIFFDAFVGTTVDHHESPTASASNYPAVHSPGLQCKRLTIPGYQRRQHTFGALHFLGLSRQFVAVRHLPVPATPLPARMNPAQRIALANCCLSIFFDSRAVDSRQDSWISLLDAFLAIFHCWTVDFHVYGGFEEYTANL
jgi:hypothetical protein